MTIRDCMFNEDCRSLEYDNSILYWVLFEKVLGVGEIRLVLILKDK